MIDLKLELREATLKEVVEQLVMYEKKHNISTIELYLKYTEGRWKHDDELEDWISWFFLFLGDSGVQRIACP